MQPREVWEGRELRMFQRHLLEQGIPLAWTVDVPPEHPHFIPTQMLLLEGALEGNGPRAASLDIAPNTPMTAPTRLPCSARCCAPPDRHLNR